MDFNLFNMKQMVSPLAFVACVSPCASQSVSGGVEGHSYVDLGLQSGTLWATCNVGASKPTESGEHFAWGEVAPKKDYMA